MHAFVNYKTHLWLCLLLCSWAWFAPLVAQADTYAADIKTAQVTLQGNRYVLSADVMYRLSPKALDALQNGVALFWTVQIKIQQVRALFWDKTLAETALRYRLQYHALLNMYRVRNENSNDVHNFSTLPAALDSMSALRDLPIPSKEIVTSGHETLAKLKVNFDRDALPLPLRPAAYLNRQWYLSSDWTVWPLTK
ncbi:MAG: DUF4390 domain-containing protein [Methylovulum sp.]|nr:DUF4390 domain-containing protein [Methylovulum sp.]